MVFCIALIVYLLTLEPTVSYWDCGEFLASAYKLEVNHPPGAPLFLMLAKVFSLLAPDKTHIAFTINALSAVTSALTVMFLFWTITRLATKIIGKKHEINKRTIIAVLGAGVTGALAYAFSDTFWFSAVEAEVYATSSLFTALVFWAILKWDDEIDALYRNRWIILICYLVGLSIGVHLLNLLAIPSIVLVVYFKKFKTTVLGFIIAILTSIAILAFVLFGIISGMLSLGAKAEIWFVNSLKMPYNSGIICYIILLATIVIGGIWYTKIKGKTVFNTVLLGLAMILAGFSSYLMVVIRSQENIPLNENRPDNILSLINYINRDQYGDAPIIYGQYFNAPVDGITKGEPVYRKENGKYLVVYYKSDYNYNRKFRTLFPRMYSSDPDHIYVYQSWTNFKGTPVKYVTEGKEKTVNKPTFYENLLFFVKYQLGYMYFRYFGWNFVGRQNNIDGDGGILYGNCISGIGFIDSWFLGPQNVLPAHLKQNKGRSTYFFLPFLLGIIGAVYHFRRSKTCFSEVLMLFFMTGIAVILYLNQTPLQVRERDYAYAGSFYAFAIWIGLGVLPLTELLNKYIKVNKAVILSALASFLAVPLLMAAENWQGHDRSGRYTARNTAFNYLNSCAPNSIIFTNGDNDTFPLWYLQEVEGVRTDVRIVNVLLLSFDWYIDQMKCRSNDSEPLPVSLSSNKYRQGNCDYVILTGLYDKSMDIRDAINYVADSDTTKKIILDSNEVIDCLPVKNFVINADSSALSLNDFNYSETKNILKKISFSYSHSYMSKNELIILDILAHNNWKRPVYYLYPNAEGSFGLAAYTRLEGFAYRLVPIYTKKYDAYEYGEINTSIMYNNIMNKFLWDGMNNKNVLIDDINIQTASLLKIRVNFARLANQLYTEGKKDSAVKVLHRCLDIMPVYNYPHDKYSEYLAGIAYKIGDLKIGNRIVNEFAKQCFEDLKYYRSMPPRLFELVRYEYGVAYRTVEQLAALENEYGQVSLRDKLKKELFEFAK